MIQIMKERYYHLLLKDLFDLSTFCVLRSVIPITGGSNLMIFSAFHSSTTYQEKQSILGGRGNGITTLVSKSDGRLGK